MKALINKLLQWLGLAPTEKDKRASTIIMGSLGKNKEYEPPKKPEEIGIYSPNYQAKVRKSPVNSSGSVYSSTTRNVQGNHSSSIRKNEDDMMDVAMTSALLGYGGGLASAAVLSSLQSSSAASDSCYSSSSSSDSYSSYDSGSSSSSDW